MVLDRRGERQGSAPAPAETLLLASPRHGQRQVRHSPAPAPAVPPRGAPGAQRERGAPSRDLQPLLLPPLLHQASRCKHLPPSAACRAGTSWDLWQTSSPWMSPREPTGQHRSMAPPGWGRWRPGAGASSATCKQQGNEAQQQLTVAKRNRGGSAPYPRHPGEISPRAFATMLLPTLSSCRACTGTFLCFRFCFCSAGLTPSRPSLGSGHTHLGLSWLLGVQAPGLVAG